MSSSGSSRTRERDNETNEDSPTRKHHTQQPLKDESLDRSKQESHKAINAKIGPRSINGWKLQDVEDKGNCFYDAVVHQMHLIGHDFLRTVPGETLPRDSLRLHIQEKDFKDEQWAEDRHLDDFVKKIDVILAIIDTRNPEANYVYYWADKGEVITHIPDGSSPLPNKPVIKIAATGNHFLSVVSEAPGKRRQIRVETTEVKDTLKSSQTGLSSFKLDQVKSGEGNTSSLISSTPHLSDKGSLFPAMDSSEKNAADLTEFHMDILDSNKLFYLSKQFSYLNHRYYYTDEDIETCINATIARSTELERAPNSTYLLKSKGGC